VDRRWSILNEWFKNAKSDLNPKHPKSSWVKGPNGDYDAVPRQYLQAKADDSLSPKKKNPWDK
jgi:hypothetical protein